MASKSNGTTTYQATVGTISPLTSAYTVAFWYLPAAAPSTSAGVTIPFSLTGPSATYDLEFDWNNTNASFFKGFTHANNGGGTTTVQIPTPPHGAWIHLAFTWDGTSLRGYLNGVLFATTAGTSPPGGAGSPSISVSCWNATNAFDTNWIAEVAIWNTTLSLANITLLFNGNDANTVGTGLVFYDHLNTGVSTVTGPTLTNHGASINTTYFLGMTGGLAIGGASMPAAGFYNFSITGGFAIGGAESLIGSKASFSATMTLSGSTGRAPVFVANLNYTGAFTQPEQHGAITAEMMMQGQFRVNSGSIANGRSGAYTTQ